MNKTVPELANRWLRRNPENLSELERRVLQSTVDRKPISRDINNSLAGIQDTGDHVADAIARIGGSWAFILSFIAFLVLWIGANWWLLGRDSFDPYPFIFLNLVLSMIAALQAPVIMMSQNRQAARDRIDAAMTTRSISRPKSRSWRCTKSWTSCATARSSACAMKSRGWPSG